MKNKTDLTDKEKRDLLKWVRKGTKIADSTSGHEPAPLLPEKTPEQQNAFNKKFIEHFRKEQKTP
jgi:hypothetical protein